MMHDAWEPVVAEVEHHQRYRHGLGELSPFAAALERGELTGRHCPACDRLYVPPIPSCSTGHPPTPTDWSTAPSDGRVLLTTSVARRPRYAPSGPDPLVLGLVQLDGTANAMLAEVEHVERLSTERRVTARFRDVSGHPIQQLAFTPIAGSNPSGGNRR